MAENKHDLDQPRQAGYERTDVNTWAIGKFGIALVLISVGAMAILLMFFHYLIDREGPAPPKAYSSLSEANVKKPAGVQLEEAPVQQLARERAAEDQILNSYGWVDKQKGIVRVPIDVAIDMVAKKGLPSRATAPEPDNVSTPSESGLGQPQGGAK
jgi:hypothetical protein